MTAQGMRAFGENSRKRPKRWSKRKWKNFKYQSKFRYPPETPIYFVFREGGDMPTRCYDSRTLARSHAMALCRKHRGEKFHVLCSIEVAYRPAIATAAGTDTTGTGVAGGKGAAPQGDRPNTGTNPTPQSDERIGE